MPQQRRACNSPTSCRRTWRGRIHSVPNDAGHAGLTWTRATAAAISNEHLPACCCCCGGGLQWQERVLSVMDGGAVSPGRQAMIHLLDSCARYASTAARPAAAAAVSKCPQSSNHKRYWCQYALRCQTVSFSSFVYRITCWRFTWSLLLHT